jgi:hypothetical protein
MPQHYEQASGDHQLPWSHAEERLHSASVFWLATTRRDGSPHVTPIWGIWIDDSLYFSGIPTAGWAKNLVRNPRAAVHLESGEDVLILDGFVEDLETIPEALVADEIITRWTSMYGRLVPDPANDGMFCFRARTVRGWTQFPEDATKWMFDSSN